MKIKLLNNNNKAETLSFLETRPIETVYLRSSIKDYGLANAQNRGLFFGCYDNIGKLTGVALFGHFFLVESDDESATMEFARFARIFNTPRFIRGESKTIEKFWDMYSRNETTPRLRNRELLLVHHSSMKSDEIEIKVRPATIADLSLIIDINAQMIRQEGGYDPRKLDPAGFRRRLISRIERERIWLWREEDSLVFKVEVLAQTPETIYIEGIYVSPEKRRQGIASRCLAQLQKVYIGRTNSICLTVNVENKAAINLYQKAGYKPQGNFTTIYLQNTEQSLAAG